MKSRCVLISVEDLLKASVIITNGTATGAGTAGFYSFANFKIDPPEPPGLEAISLLREAFYEIRHLRRSNEQMNTRLEAMTDVLACFDKRNPRPDDVHQMEFKQDLLSQINRILKEDQP
jgi:hypothetical protein